MLTVPKKVEHTHLFVAFPRADGYAAESVHRGERTVDGNGFDIRRFFNAEKARKEASEVSENQSDEYEQSVYSYNLLYTESMDPSGFRFAYTMDESFSLYRIPCFFARKTRKICCISLLKYDKIVMRETHAKKRKSGWHAMKKS